MIEKLPSLATMRLYPANSSVELKQTSYNSSSGNRRKPISLLPAARRKQIPANTNHVHRDAVSGWNLPLMYEPRLSNTKRAASDVIRCTT